jgi:drug/metabolite transporter (DMT)-like permease
VLGIIFVVIACVLWAVDTLIRYPLLFGGMSAERIVFTEHLFLTLIFIPAFIKNRSVIWQMKLSSIFYFFFIGVLGSAIATLCFTKAFVLINPSLVILLQKLQPIVAITLASFIIGEKIQKPFMFLAVIAIVGAVLISSQDIFPGLVQFDFKLAFLSEKAILGYLLTMVAVVSWGASTVFGKKLTAEGFSEIQIMGGRFSFGFIFLSAYIMANKQYMTGSWQWITWGKVLLMVLLSGLLGMYFYYKGLKQISARVCAITEMFFPLSAVAINWIFLDAKLNLVQIMGALLLVLASTIIQIKRF